MVCYMSPVTGFPQTRKIRENCNKISRSGKIREFEKKILWFMIDECEHVWQFIVTKSILF